jgi:hypothetical protein
MTTESTLPQPEMGPAPANGQGQSQGHRRRRRRRKNKATQPGAAQGQQAQSPQPPAPHSQAQPPAPRPPQPHQNQNQGKRKKFFQQKPSQPAAQPGNSIHGSSQGRRKGKQKGPREFVGPMDHSYRAVNGNVADGPPSTIPTSSNGHSHGSHYQEPYSARQAVAQRQDAPARILCFIDDLFVTAKIQETARKLGVKVEFVKGDKDAVARIVDVPEAERPKLLVFDLNNANAKPLTLIPKLKLKFKKSTSIIGFLSHLQGDLKMKAVEAGCDTVMPRSAFSQGLPSLLRRYGADEEEEPSYQPM